MEHYIWILIGSITIIILIAVYAPSIILKLYSLPMKQLKRDFVELKEYVDTISRVRVTVLIGEKAEDPRTSGLQKMVEELAMAERGFWKVEGFFNSYPLIGKDDWDKMEELKKDYQEMKVLLKLINEKLQVLKETMEVIK